MPVHRVGKDCWQWGHGKIYCGPGARQKAERQGRAAYSHGYRGREATEASSVSRIHVLRLIAEDQALGAASDRVARQLLADGLVVRYGNDGYALTRAGIDELLRHETQED